MGIGALLQNISQPKSSLRCQLSEQRALRDALIAQIVKSESKTIEAIVKLRSFFPVERGSCAPGALLQVGLLRPRVGVLSSSQRLQQHLAPDLVVRRAQKT